MKYFVLSYKTDKGGQITLYLRSEFEAVKEKYRLERSGIKVSYYKQVSA